MSKKSKGTYSKVSSTTIKKKSSTQSTQVVTRRKSKSLSALQQEFEAVFGNSIERITVDNNVDGLLIRFRNPSIIYDYDFIQKFKAIVNNYDIDYKRTALKHNPLLDNSIALIYIYNPKNKVNEK